MSTLTVDVVDLALSFLDEPTALGALRRSESELVPARAR